MTTRRQQVRLQPSYILHSRPYRDSSLLLEVFTAEYGRVSLVARGARRSTRRGSAAAGLQPFSPLLLSFAGRTDLKTLSASEPAGAAWHLPGKRMFSGLYLNELLARLLHRDDPHPQLFAVYSDVLAELANAEQPDAALRRFELTLLRELGYAPDLTRDGASGDEVSPGSWYRYSTGNGLEKQNGAQASTEGVYRGADLLAIAQGDFCGQRRVLAKKLMREVLAEHLGGQPLRSRELFQSRAAHSAVRGQL